MALLDRRCLVLAIATALCAAAPAAALNMRAGDVRVSNLGDFGFTSDASVLSFDFGATDELYQMFGYLGNANGVVRVDAADFSVLSGITRTSGTTASSTVALGSGGAADLGLGVGDVEIEYLFTLVNGTGKDDRDGLDWQITLTNTTASTLDLVFYSYLDLHLDGPGDFADDTADPTRGRIVVGDADSATQFVWRASNGGLADHFEVSAYPGVRDKLDAMTVAEDLADVGAGFGPADFSGAFQYVLQLVGGESFTLGGRSIAVIPEPSTGTLLGLGLVGLARVGRRRTR